MDGIGIEPVIIAQIILIANYSGIDFRHADAFEANGMAIALGQHFGNGAP